MQVSSVNPGINAPEYIQGIGSIRCKEGLCITVNGFSNGEKILGVPVIISRYRESSTGASISAPWIISTGPEIIDAGLPEVPHQLDSASIMLDVALYNPWEAFPKILFAVPLANGFSALLLVTRTIRHIELL